jgi:hypothetical protein
MHLGDPKPTEQREYGKSARIWLKKAAYLKINHHRFARLIVIGPMK